MSVKINIDNEVCPFKAVDMSFSLSRDMGNRKIYIKSPFRQCSLELVNELVMSALPRRSIDR